MQNPDYTRAQVENAARYWFIPFDRVPVYHRIKFRSTDPHASHSADSIVDSIHIQPARTNEQGQLIPGRFDTALINLDNEVHAGIVGSTVGCIRCIFTLPATAIQQWFTRHGLTPPSIHFAYVDWFTDFRDQPERNHGLYKISYLRRNGEQLSSVVPVSDIWQSVHLFPAFDPVADRSWLSTNVLDSASEFFVNPFSSRFAFSSIY
jgi:hypothetical protein